MKINYYLKANPLIRRPFNQEVTSYIEDCKVKWEGDESGFFKGVCISVSNVEVIGKNENGFVFKEQDNLEMRVYRIASFCSNSVYVQTKLQLLDAESLFLESPTYEAENTEEEGLLRSEPLIGYSSIWGMLNIPDKLDPEMFMNQDKFNGSSVLATYTDALRIQNPLRRFEQFFKVIEHFFDTSIKESNRLVFDKKVAEHASQYNAFFDEDIIKRLRESRNRCIHPQARLGPHNSENVISRRTISAQLNDIQLLAEIFLEHPLIEL